jgi:hypothetical protein
MAISGSEAAASAREQARAVLSEHRFHATPVPRPLRGALHSIGRALEAPLEVLEEAFVGVAGSIAGGETTLWALLAASALAVSAVLATRVTRRALREQHAGASSQPGVRVVRAGDLEHAAARAERDGRHGEAVRLRFRAGLLRIEERALVDVSAPMLTHDVARALASEQFDRLVRSFEEIAYGGRAGVAADSELARREWSRVLERARDR